MKYLGGKGRFKKDICAILNRIIEENNIKTYIEPFVGGANIIDSIKCEKRIGGDNNEYLIQLYKSLLNGYIPPEFITREQYYDIKFNKEKYPKEVVALCGILGSYNGNWFRAYGGGSETKSGKFRNYYKEGINGLYKQLPNLGDIEFICCDYTHFSNYEKTLIYSDPPYSTGDRNTYSKNQFNHNNYYDWLYYMKSKGNIVVCSEYAMPDDFKCIWESKPQKSFEKARTYKVEKLFIL